MIASRPLPPRCASIDETLYVDLDGTLCATDTLWESLLELVRRHPLDLLRLPRWLCRGKAGFKRAIADRVLPDAAMLPLRPEVLQFLQERRAAGQRLVLATAADERIARAVADRLGLFDDVLASNGIVNLSAARKLEAVRRHAGGAEFDFLGDSDSDACLLRACHQGYFAGPRDRVWRRVTQARAERSPLVRLRSGAHPLKALGAALRPHHWTKNLLIGVPLLVSHQLTEPTALRLAALAFVAFSLVASSVYIINDLLDLPADRAHPFKRQRPFASGAVSIPTGLGLAALLLAGGLALGFTAVNLPFGRRLLLYLGVTVLYSTILKQKLLLDVFVLAGLYTLRILAGADAVGIEPSRWLLAFSIFVFTSLAMVKRCAELKVWARLDQKWPAGRRYTVSDVDLLRSSGMAAVYASVLVFALYISSGDVVLLYSRPEVLWLVCPVMLYWLTRLWFLTNRSKPLDDPVLFALTDKASVTCGILVLLLILIAT